MIAIIDYGLGNIRAFTNVYKNLGFPFVIAAKPADLVGATKIILPGVGAFDRAMSLLESSGMREPLSELVIHRKVPILGICVGMQMLARSSEEGVIPGLGWIDGVVKRFDYNVEKRFPVLPHMGWNSISLGNSSDLFVKISEGARFYFLHSYYFQCRNIEDSIAGTHYGNMFSSAVNSANIYGVQFHPEKSHNNGIQLLKNFAALARIGGLAHD